MSKHEIHCTLQTNIEDTTEEQAVVVRFDAETYAVSVHCVEDDTELWPTMPVFADRFPVLYVPTLPPTLTLFKLHDDARLALGEAGWEVL